MSRKLVLILVLLILLPFLVYVTLLYVRFNPEGKVPPGGPVRNINTGLNYTTIQAAIDAHETLDGHTILVKKGIYHEHVVVNKSILLIGENRTTTVIDGNGTGIDIRVTANSVVIKEFTVKNGTVGIYLYRANNSLVMENDVVFNGDAILVYYSGNCTIHQNSAGNNTNRGILVSNSWNFTVSSNNVYGSKEMYGLNTNASTNGLIFQNHAYKNYFDGIGLGLGSANCTVSGNIAENNKLFGIWIDTDSENNLIYRNNLINNGLQAFDYNLTNRWDDGVEGNYWSDYAGVDSNHDGIGDSWYDIEGGNTDHYPLMGMFHSFNTSLGYAVDVISNSTIEDFQYFDYNKTIIMHVSNMTINQTFGFCRVCIPHVLMNETYQVTVNGAEPYYWNYTLFDDGDDRWIYFSYQHSRLEIEIIPSFHYS
jgi:parallel beta-helix repeat protein